MTWLLELLATVAEKFIFQWFKRDKTQEAIDVQNKVASYDDHDVIERLRDKWRH